MMDYKEMAEIVKARGDAIIEQKAARSRRIKRISVIASELAATAAAVFCILHNSYISKAPPVDPDETITICVTTSESTSAAAATTVTVSGKTGKTTDIPVMTTKTEANTAIASSAVSRSSSDVSTTAAASAAKENKTSSAASVPAVSDNSTAPTASAVREPVTTIALIPENEEAIRMKVENIKRYLAALSAAALSASSSSAASAIESAYSPLPLSADIPSYQYIIDNEDKMDFDGDGDFDAFDIYAMYTYLNEPGSLPEKYAENCKSSGDIDNNGTVDENDYRLLFDHWSMHYASEAAILYHQGTGTDKILFKNKDENYEVSGYSVRYVSPDCTPEEREKYLCEFVHESYTYGSDENVMDFVEELCEYTFKSKHTEARHDYEDFEFYQFYTEAEKTGVSFDINEDGIVDMKDAYDVYIYNLSLPFIDELKYATVYDIYYYNKGEKSIAHLIGLDQTELEKLNRACEPLYDLASRYMLSGEYPLNTIVRYIMKNTEVTVMNKLTPYYVNYRGDLKILEEHIARDFCMHLNYLLNEHYDVKLYEGTVKYKQTEIDERYLWDNEAYRQLYNDLKEDFDSGKTTELYDLNKDGKVDYYDGYIAELYDGDMYRGTPKEYSVIPDDIWVYLDEEFDIDNDGLAGDIIDIDILQSFTDGYLSQYEKDIIFLELLEQKNLSSSTDIEPFMSDLCDNKQSGDVDLDGSVTAADATEVLVYYADKSVNAEISGVTESKMQHLADMNDDGLIDSGDATQILCEYAENSVK